jgi:hypothetical protein
MMPSSRTGLRSRPDTVREGRPLPGTAARADRKARRTPPRSPEKRPVPISVPPSPSAPARTGMVSSRAPFLVLVLALAIGGLIGLVLLNTAVNENAFRLHDLDTKQASLDKQEQQLEQALDNRSSPAELAAQAKKMGLVPAGDPAFVVLPDGKVVGTPEPATAPSSPPAASAPSSPSTSSAKVTPSVSVGPR